MLPPLLPVYIYVISFPLVDRGKLAFILGYLLSFSVIFTVICCPLL